MDCSTPGLPDHHQLPREKKKILVEESTYQTIHAFIQQLPTLLLLKSATTADTWYIKGLLGNLSL